MNRFERMVRHGAGILWSIPIALMVSATGYANNVTETAEKDAISALEFLVGEWSGPGQSFDENGVTTPYFDQESVSIENGGTLVLINARGERNGNTFYSLHTVIYFDAQLNRYIYTPFSGLRTPNEYHCKLIERELRCMAISGKSRLTFRRLEDGRWNEFGERLVEGNWRRTFETKLRSQSDARH